MLVVGMLLIAFRFLSVAVDSGVMEFRQFIRHHIISFSFQSNEFMICPQHYNHSLCQMARSVLPD